jgi:hypothetical protein
MRLHPEANNTFRVFHFEILRQLIAQVKTRKGLLARMIDSDELVVDSKRGASNE